MQFKCFLLQILLLKPVTCFWDLGSTTLKNIDQDLEPRTSFFRWPKAQGRPLFYVFNWWAWTFDFELHDNLRRCRVIAGISIDKLTLSGAILLNRRTLLSAANYLEPWMHRQKDLRVWALGRAGRYNTPYRYRVWRVRRMLPKSNNPEHYHGSTGDHVPRHDLCIIHTLDQMYIFGFSNRYEYANRALIPGKHDILDGQRLWIAGVGFESLKDIRENYKIKPKQVLRDYVVDCSKYLPKWWGKFICMVNAYHLPGVNNGMGLFVTRTFYEDFVYALGCFEIRYNEDRIMVFTDLRYYIDWIHMYANITPGDYYEYAYPQWSIPGGLLSDGGSNQPYIPAWTVWRDLYPLGKK